MEIGKQTFVVLWSASQRAVSVETVEEMVRKNRAAFLERRQTDYVVMAIADTAEQAHEAAEAIKTMRDAPPDLRLV